MFYKHWKKFLLSLCALFWGGCSDDSSSDSKDLIACDLEQICPEYGIFYDCENEEDKIAGNYENCTMSYPACTDTYYCEDDVTCFQSTDDETKTLDCRDEKDNKTVYTEDEFKSKYYVDGQRIH
ncbi:hypothetical protein [Fibrobacter sp.]|uniref:hypothetical protein n=1 Tax=Fibrobacter sp. TaxID=35828 RepID=UPI00388F20ED